MCGTREPQKMGFYFQWNDERTLFHARLLLNRIWYFLSLKVSIRACVACFYIVGRRKISALWILLCLVLHVAIFYKIMAGELCVK